MKFRWGVVIAALFVLVSVFWLGWNTFAITSDISPNAAAPELGTNESAINSQHNVGNQPGINGQTNISPPHGFQSVMSAMPKKPVPLLALPPLDAPIAGTIEALRERADEGDARAACRVAAELRLCEMVDVALSFAERADRDRQQAAQGQLRGRILTEEQHQSLDIYVDTQYRNALKISEHCTGLPAYSPADQIRYWRQAALAGHLPSMAMYASGNIFRLRNSLSQLRELEVYRLEAEAIAQRAALAGDAEILLALSTAYGPHHDEMAPGLLAQAVNPNSMEALSLLLLAQKRQAIASAAGDTAHSLDEAMLEHAIATARTRLGAEQIIRAEQLAIERQSQYPVAYPAPSLPINGNPSHFSTDERSRCDSESFAPVAPQPASS